MCVNIIQVCASPERKQSQREKKKAREKAVVIRDPTPNQRLYPGQANELRILDGLFSFFLEKRRETSNPPPWRLLRVRIPTTVVRRSLLSMKLGCRTDGPLPSPLVIIHTNLPARTAV